MNMSNISYSKQEMLKWSNTRLLSELEVRSIAEPTVAMNRSGKPKRTSVKDLVNLILIDIKKKEEMIENNISDNEIASEDTNLMVDEVEIINTEILNVNNTLEKRREILREMRDAKTHVETGNTILKKRKEILEILESEKKKKLEELMYINEEIKKLDDGVMDPGNKGKNFDNTDIDFNGFIKGMSKEYIEKNQVSHMGRLMTSILHKNDKWVYLNKIKIVCMFMQEDREKLIFGVSEMSVMVDLVSLPGDIYDNHVDARKCPNVHFDGRVNMFHDVLSVKAFDPDHVNKFMRTSRSLQGILSLADFARNTSEYLALNEENKLLSKISYFGKCHMFIFGNIWSDVVEQLLNIVLDLLANNVNHELIEVKINNTLKVINKRAIDCDAGHNRNPFLARNWVLVHIEEFNKLTISDYDRLRFLEYNCSNNILFRSPSPQSKTPGTSTNPNLFCIWHCMSIVDAKTYNCRNNNCSFKHWSKTEVEKNKVLCLEVISKCKGNDKGELSTKFKDFFNMNN